MTNSISIFTRTVHTSEGRVTPTKEARDWRLLAFLIWKAHEALENGGEPLAFQRDLLVEPLGFGTPAEFRNALAGTKKILEAASCEEFLAADEHSVAVRPETPLDCDLSDLLKACRENGGSSRADLLGSLPFGEQSPEQLLRSLRPRVLKRRKQVGWLEEMAARISGCIDGEGEAPAPENGESPASGNAEPRSAIAVDETAETYLRSHIERCSYIDPRGMGRSKGSQDILLPLEDVYISLVVGPETPFEAPADHEVTSSDPEEEAAHLADPREGLLLFDEEEGIHFTDLIRDDRWTVLLGKPGTGKTTLLHWLTLHHARALLEARGEDPLTERRVLVEGARLKEDGGEEVVDLGPARLPILVQVGEWASSGDGGEIPELIDYLGHHMVASEPLPLEPEAVSDLVRRWLRAGRALVLLDGLDEVSDAKLRHEIVKRAERFVRAHVPDPVFAGAYEPWNEEGETPWWQVQASKPATDGGNQIVITSREHGYKEAPLAGRFRLVQARPLTMPAVTRFCHRWTLAVERYHALHAIVEGGDEALSEEEIARRAKADADRLVKAIEFHPNIRRLVENPLLLTVLALLQRESKRLPTTRLELYTEASRVLVERRTDWLLEEVVDLLGPFALWLHEHRPQGHASLEEVRAQLRLGIERSVIGHEVDKHVDAFIAAAQQQVGLLVEVGADRYGFMHGTFREYFAAMELVREPDAFRSWFAEHIHSPRWVEVSLLGVASIAKNNPGRIEAILEDVLGQGEDPEVLLHHDLLFVATCLAESPRSSPALTVRVVDRLLEVAADARESGFDEVRQRALKALVDLRQTRDRVAVPALIEALGDPRTSPIATEILADAAATTPGLLAGLDSACLSPERSPLAAVARARVAIELEQEGEDVPAHLRPLRTLCQRYPAAAAALTERETPLAKSLLHLEERVQPMVFGLLRWLLAKVEAEPEMAARDEELASLVWTKIFEMLASAHGADLSALAALALALDPERTRGSLAEALVNEAVDPPSLARYLASHPEALPPLEEIPAWLGQLSAGAITPLMRQHPQTLREPLREQAWIWLRLDRPEEARRAAQRMLCQQAVASGSLPVSVEALETLDGLLRGGDLPTRRVGEALLGTLRIGNPAAPAEGELLVLEEIALKKDDPRAVAAAVMLAELATRPLSIPQYEMVAKALEAENPLRQRTFSVLSLNRPASCVDDEVLERAEAEAAAVAESDPPVSHLHSTVADSLFYEDAERVLAAIEEKRSWAGRGWLGPKAVETIVEAIPSLPPDQAMAALRACRTAHRAFAHAGIEVTKLREIAPGTEDPGVRFGLTALAAAEAMLGGQLDELRLFLVEVAAVDRLAAAQGLRLAAHCLPAAHVPDREASALQLQEIGLELARLDESPSWQTAGARLAVGILLAESPAAALGSLGESTVGHDEIAAAILFALETEHALPLSAFDRPANAAAPVSPQGLVAHRLAEVAAAFCLGDREMMAMLNRASAGLDSAHWPTRRASMIALNAVAGASPGQFLKWGRKTDLRDKALAAGRDGESFSARRFALDVLSQFRVLDQQSLDLIGAACRDYPNVWSGLIERCRTFEEAELDISRVLGLLEVANPRVCEAAAVLIANLARSAPSTHSGSDQRRAAVRALAAAAASPNPLLDCFAVSSGHTLRQFLHERLTELVWEGNARPRSDSALGTTATSVSWDSPVLKRQPRRPDVTRGEKTTVMSQALRAVAARDVDYSGKVLSFQGDPFDFEAHRLPDLDGAERGIFMQAFYEVLEMRVGIYLADRFSAKQLDEFEELFQTSDDEQVLEWLAEKAPDYKDVVGRETAALSAEVKDSAGEIRRLIRESLEDERE